MVEVKEVAIIGTGGVGLCAIHWCLKRGLKPVAFERDHGVGGVWRKSEPPCHSPAYDSLFTNSCADLMNISDYPFPFKTSTIFPAHQEILRYYESYMKHFHLDDHIRFHQNVLNVVKNTSTSKWMVSVEDLNTGEVSQHGFDAVMVCSGKLWSPKFPSWATEALNSFSEKGTTIDLLHSKDYRNPERFKGKNVVVVGIGNSALDISLELAQDENVKSVLVSCRSPTTVLPIRDSKGNPNDAKFTRFFQYYLNSSGRNLVFYSMLKDVNKEMQNLGLFKPDAKTQFNTGQISNLKQTQEYIDVLKRGRIHFVKEIAEIDWQKGAACFRKEFGNNEITSSEVSEFHPVDAIICCTGYQTKLDFLDDSLMSKIMRNIVYSDGKNTEHLRLYKRIAYPNDPTLSFLGMITSLGNEVCVGEQQARWITALWTNELKNNSLNIDSVSSESMNNACDQDETRLINHRTPIPAFVRYLPYMDNLGNDLGCTPQTEISRFILRPSKWGLYRKLIFGGVVPAQYRLFGPDKLPAEENILTSAKPNRSKL